MYVDLSGTCTWARGAERSARVSDRAMVREEDLDVVLVPLGLAVVAGYHLWLLYAILRHPTRTVVGLNALARKRWVAVIMAVGTTIPPQK
ncbi:hypothetical protein ACQ4PT_030044 [Festuca glaucescens]